MKGIVADLAAGTHGVNSLPGRFERPQEGPTDMMVGSILALLAFLRSSRS